MEAGFIVMIANENEPPFELNASAGLEIVENQPVGTVVGVLSAVDPDGGSLSFTLISGDGGGSNNFFTMDANGTLRSNRIFDFETDPTMQPIRIKVSDPQGASLEKSFMVRIEDMEESAPFTLENNHFTHFAAKGNEIAKLNVNSDNNASFDLLPDSNGSMHLFLMEKDGTLKLADIPMENGSHVLRIAILKNGSVVKSTSVTVDLSVPVPEELSNADTSDPAYHESKLMIRDLKVVRDHFRNHNIKISNIENTIGGLLVSTDEVHGREEGDSVVLSGVEGLEIVGIEIDKDGKNIPKRNWNFLIDEVDSRSFRLRHFERIDGKYTGRIEENIFVEAVGSTLSQTDLSNAFLVGEWTFGHLLGNMVSEGDDPVEFYKHFADQWNHNQVVNGWPSGKRREMRHITDVDTDDLTLATLPYKLLAIGNRLDLFKAKSVTDIEDAGEGRFVFTNKHNPDFNVIFEYGQPAQNFATLAKWAKDWHALDEIPLDARGNFSVLPSEKYFNRLADLTSRFSMRGANPEKANGNPINQVRTNEFQHSPWQMREFVLESHTKAHNFHKGHTKITVIDALDSKGIRLFTTTTKNNPMVDELRGKLGEPLARWINQREHQILNAGIGPAAPNWMDGPIANQPLSFEDQHFPFSYNSRFGMSDVRVNLARHMYSLSTCSGCHNGDTANSPFQFRMIQDRQNQKAHFVGFMTGIEVTDKENPTEKHTFFDLRDREEIVRDVLGVAQQVDVARLRMTRTELDLSEDGSLSRLFVYGGVIADWEFELVPEADGFDNERFLLFDQGDLRANPANKPPPGNYRILIRATANDGSGVVIERPYHIQVLSANETRLALDLDPSVQPVSMPPFSTARPNRTH